MGCINQKKSIFMKKFLKTIGVVIMMLSLITFSYSTQANSIPEDPPTGGIPLPPPPPGK